MTSFTVESATAAEEAAVIDMVLGRIQAGNSPTFTPMLRKPKR